jgi:hypothetical protein
MMSETVMQNGITENRKDCKRPFAKGAIYSDGAYRHNALVLTTRDILTALREKGVPNSQIADALDLDASRVTELYWNIDENPKGKPRKLSHDEAVKLVQVYGLEPGQRATPLPLQMLRLVVRHVATKLGVPPARTEAQMADLAKDLLAFSEFVSEPRVRRSIDSAEDFFQAMILRSRAESEAPPGTDPERTH